MKPVDRPFRFTLDFVVVWALLAVPAFFMMRNWGMESGPWYSQVVCVVLLSLFATFVVYGPVLLARQIVHSGARGWLVLRVFLSILFVVLLYALVLFVMGKTQYTWTGTTTFIAIAYLHWRLKGEDGD